MNARRLLARSPAPLALMGLIFFLSAQPELSTDLGVIDLVLRKLAHMVAFGALAALWWWALRSATSSALAIAVATAAFYAIGDEYHQTFVEGRSGSPLDVAIDWLGIFIVAMLLSRRVLSRAWARGETG